MSREMKSHCMSQVHHGWNSGNEITSMTFHWDQGWFYRDYGRRGAYPAMVGEALTLGVKDRHGSVSRSLLSYRGGLVGQAEN